MEIHGFGWPLMRRLPSQWRSAPPAGLNRNFNTNVEDVTHPARFRSRTFPKDGGFGREPNAAGGRFGNQTFNLDIHR